MTPLVDVAGVTKVFGGTRALDGLSLTVGRGEIVALLGHNGSGKSTLVKMLDGLYDPDSGTVERHRTRIHVIHQTLGLVDGLSTIENLDIVRKAGARAIAPISPAREKAKVAQQLARFGTRFDLSTPVGSLTAAERTLVAIVRAVDGWAPGGDDVLILDEPTATLHDDETAVLLDSVRSIAARGVGVVYISHRLEEVFGLADRAIVLRNGRVAAEFARGSYRQSDLVDLIAGAPLSQTEKRVPAHVDRIALSVRGLRGPGVAGVDLDIHAGEVVGISGLIGSGMEHVNALIFGAVAPTSGTVRTPTGPIPLGRPRRAIRAGVGYLPADRLIRGGVAAHSAGENLTLPRLSPLTTWRGSVDTRAEEQEVSAWMQRVNALPRHAATRQLEAFSGGNQQKILLAKWLRLEPAVLLLDEPTQGVDVGAQHEIHALLRRSARAGAAVVVSSSDTHELADLCDRVLVMRDGAIVGELRGDELDEHALVRAILSDSASTNDNEEGSGEEPLA